MITEDVQKRIYELSNKYGMLNSERIDIARLVEDAVLAERERCALACDAISDDKHAQYKGHPPHAPNNIGRANTYTEGQSDGAAECAGAIRSLP